MPCTNCKSNPDSTPSPAMSSRATTHPFDAVFNRFWPPSAPFPPMAPYLAAAASRTDARRWATAIRADQDPAVLAGGTMAVLDMVGRAMMDPSGVFAGVRSEAKGKKKPIPESPFMRCLDHCKSRCGSAANCCSMRVEDGFCRYECCDGTSMDLDLSGGPLTTQGV